MIWIDHHRDEDIPQQLFYDGWQTDKDKDGRIPLRIWIDRNGGGSISRSLLEGYLK